MDDGGSAVGSEGGGEFVLVADVAVDILDASRYGLLMTFVKVVVDDDPLPARRSSRTVWEPM